MSPRLLCEPSASSPRRRRENPPRRRCGAVAAAAPRTIQLAVAAAPRPVDGASARRLAWKISRHGPSTSSPRRCRERWLRRRERSLRRREPSLRRAAAAPPRALGRARPPGWAPGRRRAASSRQPRWRRAPSSLVKTSICSAGPRTLHERRQLRRERGRKRAVVGRRRGGRVEARQVRVRRVLLDLVGRGDGRGQLAAVRLELRRALGLEGFGHALEVRCADARLVRALIAQLRLWPYWEAPTDREPHEKLLRGGSGDAGSLPVPYRAGVGFLVYFKTLGPFVFLIRDRRLCHFPSALLPVLPARSRTVSAVVSTRAHFLPQPLRGVPPTPVIVNTSYCFQRI